MMRGGYNDPLKRELERVLNGIAERYVSPETARGVYGVLIAGSIADDSLASALAISKFIYAASIFLKIILKWSLSRTCAKPTARR
jgi:hypothetical protein